MLSPYPFPLLREAPDSAAWLGAAAYNLTRAIGLRLRSGGKE
ncbi:MAG: hypothetical protein ABSH49_04270 [Bryobacteraceae bacterium]|jgi:hypothetical protein